MASDPSSLLISWGSRAAGAILVPISIYFFSHWNDALQKHGEALSSIQTDIGYLKDGQDAQKKSIERLETSLNDKVGQIVNTETQTQNRVTALEQAQRDLAARPATVEIEPRYVPVPAPTPQSIPAAIGAALSHLPHMLQERGRRRHHP